MKKILLILISILLLININACAGYKPIFGSSDLNFDIADYTITGDKQLGNQIYARLVNLSKKNSDKSKSKQLLLLINVTKSKSHTAKDEAGKILGYKISLSTKVTATDYLTEDKLMNVNFNFSSSYNVQDQYSDTQSSESKLINDLVNQTYESLLIRLAENLL